MSENLSTHLLHGDDDIEDTSDLAPPIHLSTNYIIGNKQGLIYSRDGTATRSRLENLLGKVYNGHATIYPSGQSALTSLLLLVKPKRVVCEHHGYRGTQSLFSKFTQTNEFDLKFGIMDTEFKTGDLIYMETPKNPTLELCDIEEICTRARKVPGCLLVVDCTFAPPPLFNPFLYYDIDFIYSSASKFLGGHSDILAGILISKRMEWGYKLTSIQHVHGNMLGSLETWMMLRSLRTLDLRVVKQSQNATKLAQWLFTEPRIKQVWHTSVSSHPQYELAKKMFTNGHPGVLSIELQSEGKAKRLSKFTKLFKDATSFGGVESSMDYRYRWDQHISPALIRVSIGIEDFEDLKQDILQALDKVDQEPLETVTLMNKMEIEDLIRAKYLYEAYDDLCKNKIITQEIAQQEQTKLILNQNESLTVQQLKRFDIQKVLISPTKKVPTQIQAEPIDIFGWIFDILFYTSVLILIYQFLQLDIVI